MPINEHIWQYSNRYVIYFMMSNNKLIITTPIILELKITKFQINFMCIK